MENHENRIELMAENGRVQIEQASTTHDDHVANDHSLSWSATDVYRPRLNNTELLDQGQVELDMNNSDATLSTPSTNNPRLVEALVEAQTLTASHVVSHIEARCSPLKGYAAEPLLPLSEACAPLNAILHSLPSYVQQALNETPEQPPDGLTSDESAAIRLYTMEWNRPHRSLYSMLNFHLKEVDSDALRPYFRYLKLLVTALVKLPCVPPITIWRGVTKNLSADFPPGTQVTWWAFSTCTTAMTVLRNNMYLGNTGDRTLFSVETVNGRMIRAHSQFNTEDEVLLLSGTHMSVQSQLSPAPDLHIIHLKQVMPTDMLLEPPFEGAQIYPNVLPPQHHKRRFIRPISCLIILTIGGIISGTVLGTRHNSKATASVCNNPFSAPVSYKIGKSPRSATIGRFRHSMELDVVVTNYQDSTVILLPGNGDGTLQNPESTTVGRWPNSMVLGDLNNDQQLNLAVVNRDDSTLSVLAGTGNGWFQTSVNYAVGQAPTSVVSGDFNHDQKMDLAVAASVDGTISVLLGDENGVFQTRIHYTTRGWLAAMISADFNNDQRLDMAVVSFYEHSVDVLLGNGNGTFQTLTSDILYSRPYSLTSGDFNNDSRMDLTVVSLDDNSLSVLLGKGDGTFYTPMIHSIGGSPYSVTSGDFNNDYKLDLAATNMEDHTVSLWLGKGNGVFHTASNYDVGQQPISVAVGDFNNDHKLDLAVASEKDNKVSILFGNGEGTMQSSSQYTTGSKPSFVVSGDLNHDRRLDLIVTNSDSNDLYVYLNICWN